MVTPSVDAPKSAYLALLEDRLAEVTCGNPQLHALTVEVLPS
jgi:hypothetical protein